MAKQKTFVHVVTAQLTDRPYEMPWVVGVFRTYKLAKDAAWDYLIDKIFDPNDADRATLKQKDYWDNDKYFIADNLLVYIAKGQMK